jgi:lysophospholipase L1-like esterase
MVTEMPAREEGRLPAVPAPPVPTYLFAGDGLTEGVHGESYVEIVENALGHGLVMNDSRRFDTAATVLARIEEPVLRYRPRWVILAVGGNDVWLPWLAGISLGWRLRYQVHRLRWGKTVTTDLDEFAAVYRALIETSRSASGSRVLACTASPLGERFSSPLNHQLSRLNGVIRNVAADCQAPVADVWQAFVEELAGQPERSGHLPMEWLLTWLDQRRLRSSSPDAISRRRKLHLTFDGVHLNSRGAELWALTILGALRRAEGDAEAGIWAQPDALDLER